MIINLSEPIFQQLYRPKQTSFIGVLADELFVRMNYKNESIDNNKKYGNIFLRSFLVGEEKRPQVKIFFLTWGDHLLICGQEIFTFFFLSTFLIKKNEKSKTNILRLKSQISSHVNNFLRLAHFSFGSLSFSGKMLIYIYSKSNSRKGKVFLLSF
jgi:hypothetical protein